jgi:AhpD family alkylhydroperoxidase
MSSRLTPVSLIDASEETQQALEATRPMYGRIPNVAKVLAHSPVTMRGYAAMVVALTEGALDARLRAQIALAVAEANECQYSLSAESVSGTRGGLSETELTSARLGVGTDRRSSAALRFVRALVDYRGDLTDEEVADVREAGFGDGEIVEIIANVGFSILANYLAKVSRVDIDFPIVGLAIAPGAARREKDSW